MLSHAIAAAAFLFLSSPAFADPPIVGRASVIDGDTIEIRGHRIRFDGVDAAESSQRCVDQEGREYRCGKAAAFALDEFLSKSRPTSCIVKDHDRYKRAVAVCFRADGEEVNRWLVGNGFALDWPKYSGGRYASDEAEARANGRGLWKGSFDRPCEWRARKNGRKPSC